jgi:hypothetical protein
MKFLSPNVLHNSADYDRGNFFAVVPPSISLEDVMQPRFWAHHVKRLPIHSLVEVVSEDGQFDLELRVVSSGIGYVNMRVLRKWVRKDTPKEEAVPDVTDADIPEGYTVSHAPKTRWRAFIKEPLQEIKRDLPSREHAIVAAIEHSRASSQVAA